MAWLFPVDDKQRGLADSTTAFFFFQPRKMPVSFFVLAMPTKLFQQMHSQTKRCLSPLHSFPIMKPRLMLVASLFPILGPCSKGCSPLTWDDQLSMMTLGNVWWYADNKSWQEVCHCKLKTKGCTRPQQQRETSQTSKHGDCCPTFYGIIMSGNGMPLVQLNKYIINTTR